MRLSNSLSLIHISAEKYRNHYAFKKLIDSCYDIEWVPYCKKTFNGAQSVSYTHLSKMGKAKPWMLYGYIGCAITLVCCFAIPVSFGTTAKYAWFFISYTPVSYTHLRPSAKEKAEG